ncbi:glycosyltransferase family 4 protein [Entomomonas asaccharolytica]|uniref:Glycosyltransferase family 4 protein n=1 Tax=Entomomonas asaccharolytica TaxID=2785331 RepID=A0A974NGJ9_9GAMM|nr:glycosyltransferase family 1 protein [Entomomonas asaccharolytica]QQP86385.1 glycosyltransferase family 4 protein [Entomomonas asaccharolytica]
MKIAFDHQIFSMQRYGGISRYIANLAKNIHLFGHDVKVFANFHYNVFGADLSNDIQEGRYIVKFPKKTTRFFMAYNRFITRKKIKIWQPKIIHETYYSKKSSNPTNCPTVVTVHDMIHELFKDSFHSRDNTSILKKYAVDRSQHIICVSNNTKQDLINILGIPESKISVVHLGMEQVKRNVTMISNHQKPYLLYVGHRGGYKNFNGLLKAFACSERLKKDFTIVAFGSNSFSTSEKNLMASLGLNENQVKHIIGDDDLLAALYQGATAFVYPSLYEGFGIPPLEAMINDCPVISSNISSMPEVIGDAASFFDPHSTEQMSSAIENVVYNDSYRRELVQRGQQRVSLFTWEQCARETMQVYQSIV